ncbi:MAG: DHH family phosphoesterase [Candidatus Cloacimonetes bacterium]|nr:DHH family phosphoesterase [Candidatus Cloacimonadota bacterium]
MILNDIQAIEKIFEGIRGKRVGIVTHEFPDGDGLSVSIGLYQVLKAIYEADPYIIMDSEYPSFLEFLEYKKCRIMSFAQYQSEVNSDFDLLVVLDCHEPDRIDCDPSIYKKSKQVLVIDHHEVIGESLVNEYSYFVDREATSTGVILHRALFELLKSKVEGVVPEWMEIYRDSIYTSIVNDTDNFANSNSNRETFTVISDLMILGLKPYLLVKQFIFNHPVEYFRFIGSTLSTIAKKDHIAYFVATQKMLKDNGLKEDAYSKMMRWVKGAKDVWIMVSFQEYENNLWRVSLRSETHDMAEIAQHFEGGGHKKASGFQLIGDIETIKDQVLTYIESVL